VYETQVTVFSVTCWPRWQKREAHMGTGDMDSAPTERRVLRAAYGWWAVLRDAATG
jgi:hypothetical protein